MNPDRAREILAVILKPGMLRTGPYRLMTVRYLPAALNNNMVASPIIKGIRR